MTVPCPIHLALCKAEWGETTGAYKMATLATLVESIIESHDNHNGNNETSECKQPNEKAR